MNIDPITKRAINVRDEEGVYTLGLYRNTEFHEKPQKMLFSMSRYKFVARMLEGENLVAEVGGGDGFCSNLVADSVNTLHVTDVNQILIDEFNENTSKQNIQYFFHDIVEKPLSQKYDAVYSLDVMEHIPRGKESNYLKNICASLTENGICIIGMPSLESQIYASADSKLGHVNCKSAEVLKKSLKKYFNQVFLFSMNDEVVHTGFYKMAHYLIALCCNKK